MAKHIAADANATTPHLPSIHGLLQHGQGWLQALAHVTQAQPRRTQAKEFHWRWRSSLQSSAERCAGYTSEVDACLAHTTSCLEHSGSPRRLAVLAALGALVFLHGSTPHQHGERCQLAAFKKFCDLQAFSLYFRVSSPRLKFSDRLDLTVGVPQLKSRAQHQNVKSAIARRQPML